MQSSGTSTPAGVPLAPAFLRQADLHLEIAPPRLWRIPYPAGQSPLVLPGLTRASSSFTITSNHQNILPLWPAAPPPGQPVVFFYTQPASPAGAACDDPAEGCCPGRAGAMPSQASCRSCPATAGGTGAFPSAWFPAGAGIAISSGNLWAGRSLLPALAFGPIGPGPQWPSVPVRVVFAVPYVPASSCRDGVVRAVPASAAHAFSAGTSPSFFLYQRSWRLCLPDAQQERSGHDGPIGRRGTAGTKKDVHRHGDRRTSCFTDAVRGIRTACRAGKRWPRNRRPARRHCSTGHGSGSWPGSCARRTWA